MKFLPYGRQTIAADDVEAVAQALSGDLLTTGPLVDWFEKAFAQATGAPHAIACNSGTAALHLAMLGLGVGPGQHVIVPTITFLATANCVRMAGAEVVFADVDADSGLMTPETLRNAIHSARVAGQSVSGVIVVHLNGAVVDMAGLAAVAAANGIWLVEDACHALGVPGIGASLGSRAATFSTHPVKGITTGEGGVVTTRDVEMAARLRRLRSHGMERDPLAFLLREQAFDGDDPNPWYYEMSELGWNYRLPDILCALGLSQLAKLDRFQARRTELAQCYCDALAALSPHVQPVRGPVADDGWHLYAVLLDFEAIGLGRRAVMEGLRRRGVGSQVHYIPVHLQPYYRDRYGASSLPGAARYYARCLSLPLFPTMEDADVHHVVAALGEVIEAGRRRA